MGYDTARFGDPDKEFETSPRRTFDADAARDLAIERLLHAWERAEGMTRAARELLAPPEAARGTCPECGEPDEWLTDGGHCGPCEAAPALRDVDGYKAEIIVRDLEEQGFETERED